MLKKIGKPILSLALSAIIGAGIATVKAQDAVNTVDSETEVSREVELYADKKVVENRKIKQQNKAKYVLVLDRNLGKGGNGMYKTCYYPNGITSNGSSIQIDCGFWENLGNNRYNLDSQKFRSNYTAIVQIDKKTQQKLIIDGDYSRAISYNSTHFSCKARPISDAIVTLERNSFVYDGVAKKPKVTVRYNGIPFVETDYTVSYRKNAKTGTVTMIVVTDGTKRLKQGADYTVSYKNNIKAGTATAVITGKVNYRGTKEVSFMISPKSIANTSLILSTTSYTYNGKAKTPKVIVKDGTKILKQGTDYIVSYKNNIKVGTATATITGKGNYKGTKSTSFRIITKSNPKGI